MTGVTVKVVESGQADDMAPPPGTAIVRPLRHVRAVRERYLQRFADPAEAAASRSARAWAWALGETAVAPVTDRKTTVPPAGPRSKPRSQADERRLRGDRENRADAAATILRWLIGAGANRADAARASVRSADRHERHVPYAVQQPGRASWRVRRCCPLPQTDHRDGSARSPGSTQGRRFKLGHQCADG